MSRLWEKTKELAAQRNHATSSLALVYTSGACGTRTDDYRIMSRSNLVSKRALLFLDEVLPACNVPN